MNTLEKYKWKNRIILIETDSYRNPKYLKTKDIYEDNLQEFHKRYIRLKTIINKDINFNIKLIGFDGSVKKEYKKLNPKTIFKLIKQMPISKIQEIENKRIEPVKLALYSDYIINSTLHGLGYKNKEKALHTIEAIKDKPINYQISTIHTMLGRAKNHQHQTKDMKEAIGVFNKWLKDYKKSKKNINNKKKQKKKSKLKKF